MFLDWEKKLNEFEVLITHVVNSLDIIGTKLDTTNEKIDQLQKDQALFKNNQDVFFHIMKRAHEETDQFKKSEKMFKACHIAFVQVRDACHCLREELSEAAGTMVTESWLD